MRALVGLGVLLSVGLVSLPAVVCGQESVDGASVLPTEGEPGFGLAVERFRFGSYGRVQVASDLAGGTGRPTRIVHPAPRVDEGSYAELEFGYLPYVDASGVEVDTVFTLALVEDFFHFDGEFSEQLAIRNLYAEARNLWFDGSSG